jgi:hypothetical protein
MRQDIFPHRKKRNHTSKGGVVKQAGVLAKAIQVYTTLTQWRANERG